MQSTEAVEVIIRAAANGNISELKELLDKHPDLVNKWDIYVSYFN